MPELLESVAEKETLPFGTTSEIKTLAQQERDAQERPNLLPNQVREGTISEACRGSLLSYIDGCMGSAFEFLWDVL